VVFSPTRPIALRNGREILKKITHLGNISQDFVSILTIGTLLVYGQNSRLSSAFVTPSGEATMYEREKAIPLAPNVLTPLGRGRIVYDFLDGTFAVQLEHGGGHIFFQEELQDLNPRKPSGVLGLAGLQAA
jgi:hypothetical protein